MPRDHRIAAAAEQRLLALQQQDGQHQQRHRGGRRELELRRILEQAPDLGRHGVEAGRQRQDRRRAEQRHRLQERDQGACDQRGQGERDRHPPRGGPGIAAEDRGGIFQLARHGVERIGHQHEHERERVAGDHEDDPGHRIDVEQRVGILAGEQPVELVEQPRIRRRQQFPGDRAEKRRRHERGRHQCANGLPPRHVGARHQPADRRRDDAADQRRRGRDDRGRQQRIEEIGIAEQRDEVLQRRMPALVGEGEHREPRQRQQDQEDEHRREQPQDGTRPVDAGAWGRGGGDGCGHLIRASILSPHPEERGTRVSKDEATSGAAWFETALRTSSP
ncbi:hypothetical protein ACVIST_008671 [Bradyrhizobium elkanii]